MYFSSYWIKGIALAPHHWHLVGMKWIVVLNQQSAIFTCCVGIPASFYTFNLSCIRGIAYLFIPYLPYCIRNTKTSIRFSPPKKYYGSNRIHITLTDSFTCQLFRNEQLMNFNEWTYSVKTAMPKSSIIDLFAKPLSLTQKNCRNIININVT